MRAAIDRMMTRHVRAGVGAMDATTDRRQRRTDDDAGRRLRLPSFGREVSAASSTHTQAVEQSRCVAPPEMLARDTCPAPGATPAVSSRRSDLRVTTPRGPDRKLLQYGAAA